MVLVARGIYGSGYYHHENSIGGWDAREKSNDVFSYRQSDRNKVCVSFSSDCIDCINRTDERRVWMVTTSSGSDCYVFCCTVEHNAIGRSYLMTTFPYEVTNPYTKLYDNEVSKSEQNKKEKDR